jgi:hypothetical protein
MRRVRVLQLRGDMTIDELVNSLTRKGGRVRMAFVVDVLRRVMPADQIEEEKIELKAIPYD